MADPPINVTVGHQPIEIIIKDEWLSFSSPLVLAGGWPFGENPNRVPGISQNSPTVLDRVVMPGKYSVVKWLVLLTDDANGLGTGCEINAFMRGGKIEFTQYAMMGDDHILEYEITMDVVGDETHLIITSLYQGSIDVKTMKIGMFSS